MNASRKDAKAQRELQGETFTFGETVDDALDAGFEQRIAKIDQQSQTFVRQPELRQEWLAVNVGKFLNRFQFADHYILHKQIGREPFLKDQIVRADGNRPLPFYIKSALTQFVGE